MAGRTLYHGTQTPEALKLPLPPAAGCRWWSRSDWRTYDRWIARMEIGDSAIPYANHVWVHLGFQGDADLPAALKGVRSFGQLGQAISILFVTDDPRHAGRYGPAVEVDPEQDGVLRLVPDPNIGTASAWILVAKAGLILRS